MSELTHQKCQNQCQSNLAMRCCLQCNCNMYCDICCDKDHADHIQISANSYNDFIQNMQKEAANNEKVNQNIQRIAYISKLQQALCSELKKTKSEIFNATSYLNIQSEKIKEALLTNMINTKCSNISDKGIVSSIANSSQPLILIANK